MAPEDEKEDPATSGNKGKAPIDEARRVRRRRAEGQHERKVYKAKGKTHSSGIRGDIGRDKGSHAEHQAGGGEGQG